MGLTLISATPSPYARKVRIALREKDIPFTLQTEVPWDSTTKTPQYNPLEKLPVLIVENDDSAPNGANGASNGSVKPASTAVYESRFILEWLEAKYPDTPCPLLPPTSDIDGRLLARQVEVVADGICDALVLCFFEKQRGEGKVSNEWTARQMRKVDGGIKALAQWVEGGKQYIVGDMFGLADVAAGCVLGYMSVRWPEYPWKDRYPELKRYSEALEERESFKTTRPSPQTIKDRIV